MVRVLTCNLKEQSSNPLRDGCKMAISLREVTEKLPPEIPGSETLKEIHAQAQYILKENVEFESSSFQSGFESEKQTARASDSKSSKLQEQRSEGNDEASEAVPSIDGGNVHHKCRRSYVSSPGVSPPSSENRSRSPEFHNPVSEEETSIIEQFEHGVYVTVSLLPGDVKVFKRVRF
ncbi:putative E3 ubiquitin-protein ligase HERC1, partial [Trifolium medium]|nr:putative E3 ubiquitin-protein ligase HERC1 [Trifolium medium]